MVALEERRGNGPAARSASEGESKPMRGAMVFFGAPEGPGGKTAGASVERCKVGAGAANQ